MLNWFRRHPLAVIVAVFVLFFLWLAFRPELLFVNKSVDEPFPVSTSSVTNSHVTRQ